ncbi:ATP-binding protein [Streptomyces sp. NPDC059679]|uniref:ATP-binding protein n=1 Tax=Streptomyces sp. NPDC059679 TaxID=3346903 RepID=UPI0036951C0C
MATKSKSDRTTPVVPDWLHEGAVVFDVRLRQWGTVMAVSCPRTELRQADRAWLRPQGGGREWNPPFDDLSIVADPEPFLVSAGSRNRMAQLFPNDDRSVSQARRFVAVALDRWHITQRRDDVLLCVSELATNALTHAGMREGDHFLVTVDHADGRLRVEVYDPSQCHPRAAQHCKLDEHGRGLFLVDHYSDKWGAEPRGRCGKAVWIEFETQQSPS